MRHLAVDVAVAHTSENVLLQLYFQTRLPSPDSSFIVNDLLRPSTVVLTCLGDEHCALNLPGTFCTKAVREGKSSALMRELSVSKGEIPPQ